MNVWSKLLTLLGCMLISPSSGRILAQQTIPLEVIQGEWRFAYVTKDRTGVLAPAPPSFDIITFHAHGETTLVSTLHRKVCRCSSVLVLYEYRRLNSRWA